MGEFDNDTFIEEGGEGPKGMPELPGLRATIGIQVILIILGSFGNSVTLYIYGRRGERFTHTIGILAMAVKDLLFSAIFLPFSIITEGLMYRISSDFFCKFFHFTANVTLPLTVYILTLLAIDRCICVCRSHLHATRSKLAYIAIITASCISFILAIIPALGFGVYTKIRISSFSSNSSKATVNHRFVNTGRCHFNENIISLQTVIGYHVFFVYSLIILAVAMLVVYASTGVVVYRRNRLAKQESRLTQIDTRQTGNETNENPDVGDSNLGSAEQNVSNDGWNKFEDQQVWLALIFFVSTISFWLTLLPAYLMIFHAIRGSILILCIYHVHCVTNPVVYFSMDKHFRQEVLELFRSRWSRLVHR